MKENEYPAEGVTGFLLRTIGDHITFRVYHPTDRSIYKDYEIRHHDLEVTIQGNYASFFRTKPEENNGYDGYIDYPSRLFEKEKYVLRKKDPAEKDEKGDRADKE
jgi:hypothetical protein